MTLFGISVATSFLRFLRLNSIMNSVSSKNPSTSQTHQGNPAVCAGPVCDDVLLVVEVEEVEALVVAKSEFVVLELVVFELVVLEVVRDVVALEVMD